MYGPVEVHYRSVVILRQGWRGLAVQESGLLSHDGQTLTLLGEDESKRVFSDDELQAILPVSIENHILECRGFDFFLIETIKT